NPEPPLRGARFARKTARNSSRIAGTMHYTRSRIAAILSVCVLGFILTLPNLFSQQEVANWPLLNRQIHLGLDLKGGTYLLMEADLKAVGRARLENALETVRSKLRERNAGYTDLEIRDETVRLRLNDAGQATETARVLREAVSDGPTADYAATTGPDGTI